MRELSDLECVVLGLVWRKGSCTAYAIRKEFVQSSSSYWSGSAGAIYPLMERLEKRRLIESQAGSQGKRNHLLYSITSEGERELSRWLSDLPSNKSCVITFNPLRSRMFFLDALSREDRIAFLRNAQAKLKQEVPRALDKQGDYLERGDFFGNLAMESVLHTLRSQLSWLDEAMSHLEGDRPLESGQADCRRIARFKDDSERNERRQD